MKSVSKFFLPIIIVVAIIVSNLTVVTSDKSNFRINISFNHYQMVSPSNLTLLYPNEYHNLSAVYQELNYFNQTAPELIDYSSIGKSYMGNNIPLITLTNEKIPDSLKSKTYIVAHHHAREMCTIENVLRLIRDLVNDYSQDNHTKTMLDTTIIYFIVTLNPDSLDYTLYTNPHFRKSMKPYDDDNDGLLDEDTPEDIDGNGVINEYYVYNKSNYDILDHWIEGYDKDGDGKIGEDPPGGVDLNRNYPFHWNDSRARTGSTSDKTSFTYPGPHFFSENETRVLDQFVKQHHFTHALSLHSGISTLLTGWSWTNNLKQPEEEIYQSIIQKSYSLLPSIFYPANRISYTCAGEWGDYMYSEYNIIPVTLEIYGGTSILERLEYLKENETHITYVKYYEDFKYFNPTVARLEDLNSDLARFEKFWLSLTPKITLSSVTKKKSLNGDNIILLNLNSGSLYWNTSDKPQILVKSSHNNVLQSYPNEVPVLLPEDQQIRLVLSPKIPENMTLDVNVSSNWATDLSVHLEIISDDFQPVNGFELAFICASLIIFVPIIRKKQH